MSLVRTVPRFVTVALVATAACAYDARVSPEPAAAARAPQFASVAGGAKAANGRHIVSFSGSVPADFAAQVAALGGKVLWVSPGSGLAAVSGLQGSAAAELAGKRGIQAVDADGAFSIDLPRTVVVGDALPDAVESQAAPATSFFFARQWNMRAVHANEAWAAGFLGSPNVSVFILDSGIDYLNIDLNGLVDQNRSVDLLGTFDAVLADGSTVPFTESDTVAKYFPTRQPFTDLFFHGTHVAATVSSLARGAAGVTSRTRLVAVKVCGYINDCPFSSILNGVIYAADNGADVVNLSLGGAFTKPGNGRFVGLINKTFDYARSKSVTIVVAAGNDTTDLDHDGNSYQTFCNTPAVICVAATGPTSQVGINGPWTNVDAHADYSNFGRSAINVAAPGGNRSTFVWAACSRTSIVVRTPPPASIPICQTGNFFVGAQGTSMAAPHVAGTAALLVPILGRNPGQIKARIQQSADNVAGNGTTPFYGKGRLNVARAVGAIP